VLWSLSSNALIIVSTQQFSFGSKTFSALLSHHGPLSHSEGSAKATDFQVYPPWPFAASSNFSYGRFLDPSTSWSLAVSLIRLLLYPWGKSPQYPLDRRLCGPRDSLDGMEKWKFLTLPGLELRPLSHRICSQLLYWLCYCSLLHLVSCCKLK
jgi:hypothetical protein